MLKSEISFKKKKPSLFEKKKNTEIFNLHSRRVAEDFELQRTQTVSFKYMDCFRAVGLATTFQTK